MDSDYGVPRELSALQKKRALYQPELPPCLQVPSPVPAPRVFFFCVLDRFTIASFLTPCEIFLSLATFRSSIGQCDREFWFFFVGLRSKWFCEWSQFLVIVRFQLRGKLLSFLIWVGSVFESVPKEGTLQLTLVSLCSVSSRAARKYVMWNGD